MQIAAEFFNGFYMGHVMLCRFQRQSWSIVLSVHNMSSGYPYMGVPQYPYMGVRWHPYMGHCDCSVPMPFSSNSTTPSGVEVSYKPSYKYLYTVELVMSPCI